MGPPKVSAVMLGGGRRLETPFCTMLVGTKMTHSSEVTRDKPVGPNKQLAVKSADTVELCNRRRKDDGTMGCGTRFGERCD